MDRFDIENIAPFWAGLSQKLQQSRSEEQIGTSMAMPASDMRQSIAQSVAAAEPVRPAGSTPEEAQRLKPGLLGLGLSNCTEGQNLHGKSMQNLTDALDLAEVGATESGDVLMALQRLPPRAGLDVIKAYLLAAMAKDCSIMLSIAPQASLAHQAGQQVCGASSDKDQLEAFPSHQLSFGSLLHEPTDKPFTYRLLLIDTDPKPVSKIAKHLKLDNDILAAASSVV